MKPRMPANFGASGRSLWKSISTGYALRPDEYRVLEDACREMDLVDRMQVELDKPETDLIVVGSQGQPVSSPLVQEIRQHRAVIARLLGTLKLPEEGEGSSSGERSSQARDAANARWKRGA